MKKQEIEEIKQEHPEGLVMQTGACIYCGQIRQIETLTYWGALDRTITIYTADGEIIAQYNGKIDLEGNDGGYVIFDYNGKRYTYYNCFVESIADIN